MDVLQSKESLQKEIVGLKNNNHTIGFVPTMGALHGGHLSLIDCSRQRDDITVVSIFVNPKQFNRRDDYEKYPRELTSDLKKLEDSGCAIVFTPTEQEMYPGEDERVFDFGRLEEVMEGKYRPGHFNGVARIVSKLFDLVMPHRAYFGEKDFQQLAIIRSLVRQANYDIEIVGCPIVREESGLAKSSRNERLTPVQKKSAAQISSLLFEARNKAGLVRIDQLKQEVVDRLNKNPDIDVEYFEIVDEHTLQPVNDWNEAGSKRGCVAAWVGDVRLIDNVKFSF